MLLLEQDQLKCSSSDFQIWKVWGVFRDIFSLGPVVNILAIFSIANILKNKRIKIYHIKGIGCPLLISINIVIFDQGTEK